MLTSTIASKGRVTVPAEPRVRLGLSAGTVVVFEPHADGILLRKCGVGAHPIDRLFGILRTGKRVDSLALLDALRGRRPGGPRARRRNPTQA